MARSPSRFLTRIRSTIAVNSLDAAESDNDSDWTDEISLDETDFEQIVTDSLPAQDPNPKRDSESTKVASTAHNSYCKKGQELELNTTSGTVDGHQDHGETLQDALRAFEKNENIRNLAALAAKSRRKRFQPEEDIDGVESEGELKLASGDHAQNEGSPPNPPTKDAAFVEQEIRLERVSSWVTFDIGTEECTETPPPPPPPKDRARAEAGAATKKFKRVFKRIFCIASDMVSMDTLSRIQLPLTQNVVTSHPSQPPSLGLSFTLAFSAGAMGIQEAQSIAPSPPAPSFHSGSRCRAQNENERKYATMRAKYRD